MNTLVTVELPTNIRRMPAHDQPERAYSLGIEMDALWDALESRKRNDMFRAHQ